MGNHEKVLVFSFQRTATEMRISLWQEGIEQLTTLNMPISLRGQAWNNYYQILRCELDAAFFHLYLPSNQDGTWKKVDNENDAELIALTKAFPTPRHAVDYIMDTFLTVRSKDEAAHGEYRTKRVILEVYDELQQAIATGKPYQTRLDPPPADIRSLQNLECPV